MLRVNRMDSRKDFPFDSNKPRSQDKAKHWYESQKKKVVEAWVRKSQNDFLFFVRGINIDGQFGKKMFEKVMGGYQRFFFEDIAPDIQKVRDGEMPETQNWWIERTKKAGKDSDLAIIVCWLLAFPTRPFYGQIGAADREQASIVKKRISALLYHNPILNDYFELTKNELKSKKTMPDGKTPLATFDIMSSDVSGAHGGTPDVLVINELSHITKWEFAENLMDNAAGVAQGLIVIATNAGYRGTAAHVWRDNSIKSDLWKAHILSQPAPWMTERALREAKLRNSSSRFRRLYEGLWITSKGDALDEASVEACFCLDGPISEPERGWMYVAGLDLGVRNDHSALMVLGIHPEKQIVKTAYWRAWEPESKSKDTPEVDLEEVEAETYRMSRVFRVNAVYYDPYQAIMLKQRLQKRGVNMVEVNFSSPKMQNLMATALIAVIKNQRLQAYDSEDERFRGDLSKFSIEEAKFKSYKLTATRDESGHADVGVTLVMCLAKLSPYLVNFIGLTEDDSLILNEEKLSKEEEDEMDEGLREIYEMPFEDMY